ncbi:kinase-like protein [Hesseltinella vesiculosa]|uniref:Kinase-like protein n=1 Tax=Hesseltinella vesiculosa TaxID=101127 RepID=A0A1X2G8L3_9FUNG|nr:kinase-like protein [Hesseltinella vesiculosa]
MKGTFAIIEKESVGSMVVAVKKYYKIYGNLVLQHYERERWAFQKLALMNENDASHRHLIYLLEAKTLDDAYCLTLPFYPHTLLEFASQAWPRHMALAIFQDLIDGVNYIHRQGIAHCDLSLSNILMDSPPNPPHIPLVVISDFGCAHPLATYYHPTTQQHGADIGTRQFKAPEHLFGSSCYTTATDIWSLGVIFASLLLGRLLYPSQGDLEQMGMIVKSLGPPNETVVNEEMVHYPDTDKLWFFGHEHDKDNDDDESMESCSDDDMEPPESFLLKSVLSKANINPSDQSIMFQILTWSVRDRASLDQIQALNVALHTPPQLPSFDLTEKLNQLGDSFRYARQSIASAGQLLLTPATAPTPVHAGHIKGKLDVCIVEARSLSIAKVAEANVFCKITYLDSTSVTPDLRSMSHLPDDLFERQRWATCPKWQHTCALDVTSDAEDIFLHVYDRGQPLMGGKHQCLGVAKWTPRQGKQTTDIWLKLKRALHDTMAAGEIRIQVTYTTLKTNSFKPADFHIRRPLGHGAFGKVYQVEKRDTKQIYAMKVLSKQQLVQQNQVEHTLAERNVLIQAMNSPYIVSLKCCFQTQTHLFLVMDYLPGGDLSGYLQRHRILSEDCAKLLLAEIICAIETLHQNHILYRDLKPENILLDKIGHVTLTDFGLCKQLHNTGSTSTFCGTSEYLAPEMVVLHQSPRTGATYTEAVDWWELGILLYEVLTGDVPFHAARLDVLYHRILQQSLTFPSTMSPEAKHLIQQLLQRDPIKRLQHAHSIKHHPFFSGIEWNLVATKRFQPPCPPLVASNTPKAINISIHTSASFLSKSTHSPYSFSCGNVFDGFSYVVDHEELLPLADDNDDWLDIE